MDDNVFVPLTADELDTASSGALPAEAEDGSTCVQPVPSDAPPPPEMHPYLGAPSTRWTYHDADGRVLFLVCRFDNKDGGKDILPLSLWSDKYGHLVWKWKGIPAPRPLFNLDKIAAKPDAWVVVVEGEKSAAFGEKIFPNSVVTTSPNGSKAAGKADWSALAGRRVLIWADADAAGAKYAREVAEILSDMGCDVSTVDGVAAGKISPDGGARDLPKIGWDAADAVEEWSDLTALRTTIVGLLTPFKRGPAFISFGPYTMRSDGLWVEVRVGRGDDERTEARWVCSAFEILGEARDEDGKNWSKLLCWSDRDGRRHEFLVADSALHGDASALAGLLASEGLRIEPERRKALASYLITANVRGRVTRVLRTGWHTVKGRRVFVMPDEVIGASGAERVLLSTTNEKMYRRHGTLDGWRRSVGELTKDHALACIAIAAALAGPLLELTGEAGGGVHFEGYSSRGKSTLQYCAASVWGEGGDKGFMRTWSATSNALEAIAALATDTVLVLDEMNQIDSKAFHHVVYSLANGKGKGRANRDGGAREAKSWRVMIVSSGEMTVAAKLSEERGKTAKAGQLVRLLDIPAERGFGFGCFDSAGPTGDANDLATKISDATRRNYGWAGPEFVRRIIAEDVTGDDVMVLVNKFVADNAVADPGGSGSVDPQVKRVAKKFGIIAAAGELAVQLGVVPWRKGDAWRACVWAFESWVARRGGMASSEDQLHIRAVKLFIELHGESRFEVVGSSERVVSNRAGWKRGDGDDRVWHFSPEVFQTEVCAGFKPSAVAETLARHGCLKVPSGKGLQDRVRINKDSAPIRVYTVTAAIMQGDDEQGDHGDAA